MENGISQSVFQNVVGGYEIRSRYFKGCVPPKDVSLVKMGEGSPTGVCSLFEGFMDFLSAATLGLETGDSLVLNSVANVGKAVKHLDGYGRIDCFLDRDEAGRRTLEALRTLRRACLSVPHSMTVART